jgi:putative Mg2+ transporter-C (MgtC) family protein
VGIERSPTVLPSLPLSAYRLFPMIAPISISEASGQGPKQFLELGLAFLLSAAIGLERELRRKSAGLRTYTVVGTSAALFLLISKYGFNDVLTKGAIVLDPSRVAAQIVTGIGFIGAGIIFVQGNRVKGLTTAATVWLVTAVGMACGAGLPWLALAVTLAYFVVALAFPPLVRRLVRSEPPAEQSRDTDHD